jgi:hypothetical protein
MGPSLVRAAAVLELAVGLTAVVVGGRAAALAVAVGYAAFAGLTLRLAQQRASCGCFGAGEAPSGGVQLTLSAGLATVAAAAAAVWPPAAIGWVLAHSPGYAMTLLGGVGGCIYALAIAYTQLPIAWAAWSGR